MKGNKLIVLIPRYVKALSILSYLCCLLAGHDKVHTLTHCRFEAKAVYGIDKIIVSDYDEFFHCSGAADNRRSQVTYMREFLDKLAASGVDQATLRQQTAPNLTADPRACIIEQAEIGKSILNCFGSHKYYVGGHSVKSAHLGHKCPLTGYHEACGGDAKPRTYNCICEAADFYFKPCSFMHLTTNVLYFQSEKYRNYMKNHKVDEMIQTGSDLLKILHSD